MHSYGENTIFNVVAIRHVEFLKILCGYGIHFLSSRGVVVCHISSKSDDFSLSYSNLTICYMLGLHDLEISKFRVEIILKISTLGHVTFTKFQICSCTSKSDDLSLRYANLMICKMAAVRHLEFSKFRVYST